MMLMKAMLMGQNKDSDDSNNNDGDRQLIGTWFEVQSCYLELVQYNDNDKGNGDDKEGEDDDNKEYGDYNETMMMVIVIVSVNGDLKGEWPTVNPSLGGRNSSLVVFGLAVHSVAGLILLWGNFPVEGIFPLELTWVQTPFPQNLFRMRV